jgi:secreted Zn-dependent insulinase-like peptidase
LQITLTEKGFLCYAEILQLIGAYLTQAVSWIPEFSLFDEARQLGMIAFEHGFKTTDQQDNCVNIATWMLFGDEITRVLVETYPEVIF